jgi:hypothetical protein
MRRRNRPSQPGQIMGMLRVGMQVPFGAICPKDALVSDGEWTPGNWPFLFRELIFELAPLRALRKTPVG